MLVAAVEQLLHRGVRRPPGRARHAGRALVERHPGADQVDGDAPPLVADQVRRAVDRDAAGGGGREPAVAELREQHLQPALTGEPGGGVAGRRGGERRLERRPRGGQAGPGAVGGGTDGLALDQVVVARLEPGQAVALGDAGQRIGWQ
ncbi:MAG TPA: hypothetical protein VII16_14905 [Actinomycetes bacterium]